MDKQIETITIDTEKLKPIRCKGRYKGSYVSNARPMGRLCGNLLAFTDGVTIIESPRFVKLNRERLDDSDRYLKLNEDVKIRGLEAPIVYESGARSPRIFSRWNQGGRSILYRCPDCGKERKVVGMQYAIYHVRAEGSSLFDILNFT